MNKMRELKLSIPDGMVYPYSEFRENYNEGAEQQRNACNTYLDQFYLVPKTVVEKNIGELESLLKAHNARYIFNEECCAKAIFNWLKEKGVTNGT